MSDADGPGGEVAVDETEIMDLSASMEFVVQRDQEQRYLPITPLLPCEHTSILQLCNCHVGTRQSNTNQHGSIDFDAAAVTWNSLCDDEMAKPIEERTKTFPKTAGLLWKFYKQEQKWVNQERTMRQIIQVPNANGVSHPVLASHEIVVFRDELRQENAQASFQEPMSQPAPLQRSTTVPQGEGETVALPPIEVNAASQNELVMQTVHKGCHLTAPVQQLALHPAVEPVQRC